MVGNRKKYPRRCVRLNFTKRSSRKQGVMAVSDVSSLTDDNTGQNCDAVAEQSSDATTACSDNDYISPLENLAEMPTPALSVCSNIEQVVASAPAPETNTQISISITSVTHAQISTSVTSIEHSWPSAEPSTSNLTPVTTAKESPSADHDLSVDPVGHVPGASQSRNMYVGVAGSCMKIKDITERDCLAVWGVVKYVYSPTRSKGSDWVLNFGLVDDSVDVSKDEKLRCHLFMGQRNLCESVKKAGQIVRLSGVKIIKYNGQHQAVATGATKIEVWSGDIDGSTQPVAGGHYHTLTDADLKKLFLQLQEMRAYRESIQDLLLPPVLIKKLQEIRPNDYATVYCQIVGICHMRTEACLLRVWDGTTLSSDMKGREIIFSDTERLCYSEQSNLASLSKDLTIDVFLYNEHATCAKELNLQAGDFVKLVKLHCKPFRLTETYEAVVDFIMHRGLWDDKEVVKLNYDDPEVTALQRLSSFPMLIQASQDSSSSSTIIENSGNENSVGNVSNAHEDKNSRKTLASDHENSVMRKTETEQTEEKEKVTPQYPFQENNEVLVDDKILHVQPEVLSPWLLEIICKEAEYCKNTHSKKKVST